MGRSRERCAACSALRVVRDGKDTLFLYSFMFVQGEAGRPLEAGCPSCTSIIDAIDGEVPHIAQRINFAVVAKAPIERFRAHAQTRGWRHARLLSSADTTYNHDYKAEGPDESQYPLATVFVRRGRKVHHFWSSELYLAPTDPGQDPRHVDFLWPLWAVLDHTPEGRDAALEAQTRLPLTAVRREGTKRAPGGAWVHRSESLAGLRSDLVLRPTTVQVPGGCP